MGFLDNRRTTSLSVALAKCPTTYVAFHHYEQHQTGAHDRMEACEEVGVIDV